MLRNAFRSLSAHPAATAFACLFLAGLFLALLQGSKPFYFDSGNYWDLAASFDAGGHFSPISACVRRGAISASATPTR